MNAMGGSWMGANWGWATAATSTNITVYPHTVSYSDSPVPGKERARTALDWLRQQVEDITDLAIA
jgi:hypothetical protein